MRFQKWIIAISFVLFSTVSASLFAQDRQFAGLGFGVGISLTLDTGEHDRILEAILDENGVVRISKESNDIPRIMLESHYFFTCSDSTTRGYGPFIALQPGTEEIIEAVGIGFMVGLKRSTDPEDKSSWNIGVGAVVDPAVRVFGEGIVKDQPLPSGETNIRYQETSQFGVLLVASFSF